MRPRGKVDEKTRHIAAVWGVQGKDGCIKDENCLQFVCHNCLQFVCHHVFLSAIQDPRNQDFSVPASLWARRWLRR